MAMIRKTNARLLLSPRDQMMVRAIGEAVGTEIRLAALDTARARLQFVMDSAHTSAIDVVLAKADLTAAEAALAQRTYAEGVPA